MQIFKYSHSCVRLEKDGRVLVIDPGAWSEPAGLRGADAVLVTHEHGDHVDLLRLTGLGVPVFAPAGAQLPGLAPTYLGPAESREIAGFAVTTVGALHATVHRGQPDCAHLGYVVDDLYHPGDSVHPPGVDVRTLLVPMQASWLRTGEAIDFVQAVNPEVAIGIHEGQLNERGLDAANGWLTGTTPQYHYLSPGDALR